METGWRQGGTHIVEGGFRRGIREVKEPLKGYVCTDADKPFRTGFSQIYHATDSGDSFDRKM
jgi:hypothetical protein